MVEDRSTRLLRRWIPVVVLANLAVAVTAFKLNWPAAPIYVLLALTGAATISAAILYLGSVRGVRSLEALGFDRTRDFFPYYLSGRGFSVAGMSLIVAAVAVFVFTGFGRTPSSLLAIGNLLLLGVYRSVSTRFPADEG